MKLPFLATSILVFLLIAGCAEQDRYPISGEACADDDPVKTLSAGDCLIP